MKLTFLGAAGTVTGSKYLLDLDGDYVLIDCGLFQGLKQLRLRNWESPGFDATMLRAVLLTHAHIDHSGYLPLLVRRGFRGPIYATPATIDLCGILLPDAGRLQEEDADEANRSQFSKHRPALPLFTEEDARRSLEFFVPVEFDSALAVSDRLTASFHRAGHILGAAMVRVESPECSVLFSGDVGRPNDLLMLPPVARPQSDYLVIESTYGDREHQRIDVSKQFADIVNRTVERGGVIIVPAFAVGRAQTLLYIAHMLREAREIPDVPVFLSSPMAVDATELFHSRQGEHRLSSDESRRMHTSVKFIRNVEESIALNHRREPMIIISASGMATGGRVLHHIEAFGPDPRNTILFAGYQSVGTRGADLVGGAGSVWIHGHDVRIRAEVASLENISSHADVTELMQWLSEAGNEPRVTFITHGEPVAADALRRRIEHQLKWQCYVPEHRQSVRVRARSIDTSDRGEMRP